MTTDIFTKRYKKLNANQKTAVDTIHGPLLVIAGPGTGKTELLSMRAANILKSTDTLPQSILCLTFTDSGAVNMRSRLSDIIGADAYKVSIHTFHSFGAEIINQQQEYFYNGMEMKPADELLQLSLVRSILDKLDHTNPLTTKNNGEYIYLREIVGAISEIKRSGLTSDELRLILETNEIACDVIEKDLAEVFKNRISASTLHLLAPIAQKIAEHQHSKLPAGITPYANVVALSLAHAVTEASEINKTTPITAWKNKWMKKNETGDFVFKDRDRHKKLIALAYIYNEYISRMQEKQLFDFDDMILQIIHTMETNTELRANLQEKYQYIMVDEFQDTNLAQLRILFDLTNDIEQPNIMAVGDDDQAIFSFQGASVNNIHRFLDNYTDVEHVVLTDNYRSAEPILTSARSVITQSTDRLEHTMSGLDKQLTAHAPTEGSNVCVTQHATRSNEFAWVAHDISKKIKSGVQPSDIAIITRKHFDLQSLIPYLAKENILPNYERRDNAIDHPIVILIEKILTCIVAIKKGNLDEASVYVSEIIAHPVYGFEPADIWKLSLKAYRERMTWLEAMEVMPTFADIHTWLIHAVQHASTTPLEQYIDHIIGTHPLDGSGTSPLYTHFFNEEDRVSKPQEYLNALESLRTIRDALREHSETTTPSVEDFLAFLDAYREFGLSLTTVRQSGTTDTAMVHVLSAHKSKGLEYKHVYIVNATDAMWGEKAKGRSRLISYPENLPLQYAGGDYAERMRLFFVAMTRAKHTLTITYADTNDMGKNMLKASFLVNTDIQTTPISSSPKTDEIIQVAETQWHDTITQIPTQTMQQLLASTLEKYKLSATHLGNFLDVTRGGPQDFLLKNILRFPQAKSPNAAYGTAIHGTLQHAHNALTSNKQRRPVEDILGDFKKIMQNQHLSEHDFELFYKKGIESLSCFLSKKYDTFMIGQKTELSFANQQVQIGEARLSGALDLTTINNESKTITVTDYKTGNPSNSWKGGADYQKIKLHKYRQQLMFYQLLTTHSRDYSQYEFERGILQFVEPSKEGEIYALDAHFTTDELETFSHLIQEVWHCIMTLKLPDISEYEQNYKGILAFEADMLAKKYRV